jgi:hypothetical protein
MFAITVEKYVAPKAPCNANAASASAICSVTADTCPVATRVGNLTFLVSAQTHGAAPVLLLWGRLHGEIPGLREMERGDGDSSKVGA